MSRKAKVAATPAIKKGEVIGLNQCAEHEHYCINADKNGACKSRVQPCCVPIVEQCKGCSRTRTFNKETYCQSYMRPDFVWHHRICPMATHLTKKKEEEQKINPLKASKKSKKAKV